MRMKITALLASAAMALSACATMPTDGAETTVASLGPAATLERVDGEGPALWKVADEDTTIYMFGTIHILPANMQWSNVRISDALTSSDSIVTELMPGAASTPESQQMFMSGGMLSDGRTLRSLMSDDERARYEAALGKIGLPAAAFDQMKPWLAAITLSIVPLMQNGYDIESGVEEALEKMASQETKRDALETVEYQFNVFDGMPEETQLRYLLETADQVDNIKSYVDSMVAEWLEGDADALADMMNEGLEDPVLAERLLYTRNKNWAEWIDNRLDQPGTVFMAVGAGHLAGEKSVQDYLVDMDIATVR